VPDFTSALYLGMHHPSRRLGPWAELTTGAPAALRRVPGAVSVERRLAGIQGCEASVLVPSSLHAAWDLGGLLDPGSDELLVDAETYPVLRCTSIRAAARGTYVREFTHHDADALARSLGRRRPVVLVDGVCPACGVPAPLRDYLRIVRRRRGVLVVDDTQAIGILGAPAPGAGAWGRGGGGSVAFHGLAGARDVLIIASAAKALGVPVATVSGPRAAVETYQLGADTWVHSSPVSAADVRALEHALDENRDRGDELRSRLVRVIDRFRAGLHAHALPVGGAPLPIQGVPALPRTDARGLHRSLLDAGVRTVLVAGPRGTGRVVFLLSARHTARDIDAALAALAAAPQRGLRERAA
jgi:8-amino-7-oxononanoate synthase